MQWHFFFKSQSCVQSSAHAYRNNMHAKMHFVNLQPDEMINCIVMKAQVSNNSHGGLNMDVHFYLNVAVGFKFLSRRVGWQD